MRFLASRGVRIFLVSWILYSAHFATNVVREHYPAFSISEHGTFFVDEYQGFHSDIFRHTNGHSVIGNQVFVSVLAAVPLFVFRPVLDRLESYSKAKLAREGVTNDEYRIDKPMRQAFFKLVKERGLDLRFGAATVITTVFFMAPATALFLVFFHAVLRRHGVAPGQAVALTFLLGFGTPLFFRTSTLNHNLFVMYAMFASWVLLWRPDGERVPAASWRSPASSPGSRWRPTTSRSSSCHCCTATSCCRGCGRPPSRRRSASRWRWSPDRCPRSPSCSGASG